MNNSEKKEYLFEFLKGNNDDRKEIINSEEWKGKIPKYLFRYRPLEDAKSEKSKNEFAALRNEQIWGSKPSAYKDDTLEIMHNSLVSIDLSIYKQDIDNAIDYILYGKKGLDRFSLPISESVKAQLLYMKKEIKKQPLDYKKRKMKEKEIRELLTKSISIENKLSEFRDDYVITCFSDEEDCEYMWKEYASNYKGYCLKYDIQKLYDSKFFVVPVNYSDEQVDINKQLDAVFFLKYNKYIDESEWRHVNHWDKTNPNGCLDKIILPDELICGKNIDNECKLILKDICDKKGTIKFQYK